MIGENIEGPLQPDIVRTDLPVAAPGTHESAEEHASTNPTQEIMLVRVTSEERPNGDEMIVDTTDDEASAELDGKETKENPEEGGILEEPKVLQTSPASLPVKTVSQPQLPFVGAEDHSGKASCSAPASDLSKPILANSGKSRPHCRSEIVPLILLSLPIDSLHCIASFLSATDWASFGGASTIANRLCRDIFRRVRMHGFRCATEIVAAWKSCQLADARELAALYLQSGVPVYPYCLGHSYHTLVWRMSVEAKDTEAKRASVSRSEENPAETSEFEQNTPPIDAFYDSRYDPANQDAVASTLSYLERKGLFWQDHNTPRGPTFNSPARFSPPPRRIGENGLVQQLPQVLTGDELLPQVAGNNIETSPPRENYGQSMDSSLLGDFRTPKVIVKAHRHLIDQFKRGRPAVDDENGSMYAAPLSLAADFFHPVHGFLPRPRILRTDGMVLPKEPQTAHPDDALAHEIPEVARFIEDAELTLAQIEMLRNRLGIPEPTGPPLSSGSPSASAEPAVNPLLLSNIEFEEYSAESTNLTIAGEQKGGLHELKCHLRNRFSVYQRRLDVLMVNYDNAEFEECLLDFWDEFLPVTANVHFYDRHTAVPRLSGLHKFLTKPCPKAFGIVQCEIERLKIVPKKKGVNVKGRFFPTYEYRLFIRDRRNDENASPESAEDLPVFPRRDTVLMMAKNRGRRHLQDSGVVPASGVSKKGVNNYYLYAPQQIDIDAHHRNVNDSKNIFRHANGASILPSTELNDEFSLPVLLGRLQSNFIGTEFQIFTPTLKKRSPGTSVARSVQESSHESDGELDYDSGFSSDNMSTASSNRSSRRKNRFHRSRQSNRRSRRRNHDSDHPQPIEEDPVSPSPEKRKSRRTYSLPVLSYGRSARTNRRAIANSMEASGEVHQQCQTVICEEEDGVITYTANLLGSRPRIMDVCLPKVADDCVAGADWKRFLDSFDDSDDPTAGSRMLTFFKQMQSKHDNLEHNTDDENGDGLSDDDYSPPDDYGLLALQNRPPWWNAELGAFVLNFGGRVSVASVKNFQLCDRNDQGHVMLQFGRIDGRHSFTMDCQFPLSPVQAFAIAISSLQSRFSFG